MIGALLLLATLNAPIPAVAASDSDTPISSAGSAAEAPGLQTGASGVVHAPDGTPIAAVLVAARSLDDPPQPIPEIGILSNGQGVYAWPLKPGRYELTPVLSGRKGTAAEVVVEDGKVSTRDLEMPQ